MLFHFYRKRLRKNLKSSAPSSIPAMLWSVQTSRPCPDVVCTASTLCQVSNSSYLDGSIFDIFPRFLSSHLQSVDIFPIFHSVVCWHSHIHGRASSFFFLLGWDGQSRCQNSKAIFIFQDSFWSVLILVVEIVKPSLLA